MGKAGGQNRSQNRFRIEVAFGRVLGPILSPHKGPKSSPRGSREAPQTLLGRLGAAGGFRSRFGSILTLILHPPEPWKSCSRRGAVLLFTKIASRAQEPKIGSKMTPKMNSNWIQNGPLAASGGLKVSSKAVLDFSPKPKSFFDDFQAPKGALNGAQNRSKTGLGAQGPPRGRPRPAQKPPGSLLEAILSKFRTPPEG